MSETEWRPPPCTQYRYLFPMYRCRNKCAPLINIHEHRHVTFITQPQQQYRSWCCTVQRYVNTPSGPAAGELTVLPGAHSWIKGADKEGRGRKGSEKGEEEGKEREKGKLKHKSPLRNPVSATVWYYGGLPLCCRHGDEWASRMGDVIKQYKVLCSKNTVMNILTATWYGQRGKRRYFYRGSAAQKGPTMGWKNHDLKK